MRVSSFLATLAVGLAVASAASAQQPYPYPPPSAPPPPPASAQAGQGEYVAPMQQPTQPTYVPQSVAMSGPAVIKDWNDGDPIPYGYHRGTRARTGLVVAGAVTFGSTYLISALVAAASVDATKGCNSCRDLGFLFVPVLGPFIEMGRGDNSATGQLVLAIDGIAQAAGAAMLIGGITMPKVVLVRNDLATNTKVERASFTPYVSGTGGGILGTF